MLDFNDQTHSASPEQTNSELLSEFLNQHKRADEYAARDIDNCHSGLKGDRETINLLNDSKSSPSLIAKILRGDIDQDRSAEGYDRQSEALDQALIDLDQRVLNSGMNLSSSAQQSLREDIKLHNTDSKLSEDDMSYERMYAQDDQALLTAMSTGIGVAQAIYKVQQDRIKDMDTENKFLKNNLLLRASHQRLIGFFGDTK